MKDSGLNKLAEYLLAKIASKELYRGVYLYRVAAEVGTIPAARKVDLTPVSTTPGLPAITGVDKAHGLLGAYESMPVDSTVLVGFVAGDPSQPFVLQYVSGTPIAIELIPQTKVKAYSSTAPTAYPVALATALVTLVNSLQTYLNALHAWAALVTPAVEPPIPPGPIAGALATATAALGVLSTASSTSVQPSTAGGMVSQTLEAS